MDGNSNGGVRKLHMKKILIAIAILFSSILLVVTNPSKEDFITWVREEVTKEMKDNNKILVGFGFDIFGDKVINSATNSSNYVLFSIYDVGVCQYSCRI